MKFLRLRLKKDEESFKEELLSLRRAFASQAAARSFNTLGRRVSAPASSGSGFAVAPMMG